MSMEVEFLEKNDCVITSEITSLAKSLDISRVCTTLKIENGDV